MEEPETARPPASPSITGVRAVRLVTPEAERYASALAFYSRALGRRPDEMHGDEEDSIRAAVWRLADGLDLILALEREPTPEAFIDAGPVWLALSTLGVDEAHAATLARGLELLNEPIDTAFGTRAFFANDPAGLVVTVGTPWPRP